MKNIKIIVSIIIVLTMFSSLSVCYGGLIDDIFSGGNDWFNNGKPIVGNNTVVQNGVGENGLGQSIADFITGDILNLIGTIGNLIFFIVAAFLGIKYIWSGVSGKSEVKETLPSFVIGAMFFYTAQIIYDFSTRQFFDLTNGSTFDDVFGSIWLTVAFIVQILSIAGVIAIGLKYMLSSADTKADIKKDLLPVVIGLVFVFSSTKLIPFIIDISKELFK